MRVVVFAMVLAAACTQSQAEKDQVVCSAFCGCFAVTQAAVDECIQQQCLPSIPMTGISDACETCVYQNESTCSALEQRCTNECF